VKNILTFDVEEGYHSNLVDSNISEWGGYEDRIVEPTLRILKLLSQTGNTATFFILGAVAEKFPELIRRIKSQGHEIASHGYGHKLVYGQNREEFVDDLLRSKNIVKEIIGENPIGYRAPSWSFNENTDWIWEALYENGFRYDSSKFPFKTFLYGSHSNPRFLHGIEIEHGKEIWEIPPSTTRIFGKNVPFSGGFYFRSLPYWFIKYGINRVNKVEHRAAVLYLHPWELDPGQPKLSSGIRHRFIQYYNLGKTEQKLSRLLHEFRFVSIKHFLITEGLIRGVLVS